MTFPSPASHLWFNGAVRPWDEGQVHLLTHTLHYGLGVFEGIRSYAQSDGGVAIFCLAEHLKRLYQSAKICMIEIPYTFEELHEACLEVVRKNKMAQAYLRPLVFLGDESTKVTALDAKVNVAVIGIAKQGELQAKQMQEGVRVNVSSFTRGGLNSIMAKGKICGQYVNSVLAKREALKLGFEEAILLDTMGHVTEGTTDNIFIVRNGRVMTPPASAPILEGITRACVMQLARDMGYEVSEVSIARDELYLADEVFLTGTSVEITPVREIDHRVVGEGGVGPTTKKLQAAYSAATRGSSAAYAKWLTHV